MLKLKSTNGKFDIVFESDPVIEDNSKLSGIRATSAGRRKNLEWKSKVLPKKIPKEANLSKVKTSKATKLRNERLATKYDRSKKENTPSKTHTIQEDAILKNEKVAHSEVAVPKDHDLIDKTASKNMDRRDTFTFKVDSSTGVISKQGLETINKRLQENTIEPLHIPGLTPDSKKATEKKETTEESSPDTTLESDRQDAIRKKQATPVEIYDPWGKPGAGAPMKSMDGGVRTHRNVGLIQKEKEKGLSEQTTNQVNSPPTQSPRMEEHETPAKYLPGGASRFVRGQGKQKHELVELDKKRQKHLEHQQAIAAQVEERRLLKQLEKEKKRKEEEEAELRYQKQQELMRQRLEEEKRKEQEKQEAKMLKQRMLEESIKKAEEEARKAKDEARRGRMKTQVNRSTSPDLSTMSPKYKRILHNDNDAIRPSQNFDEELASFTPKDPDGSNQNIRAYVAKENEPPKERKKLESRIPKPKKKVANKENNNVVNNKNVFEDMHNTVLDDYLVPYHRSKTADMYNEMMGSGDEGDDSEIDRFLKHESSDEVSDVDIDRKKNRYLRKDKTILEVAHIKEEEQPIPRGRRNTKKPKQISPRRSVDNDVDTSDDRANYKTTADKKPATSPQVNTKGKRTSPRRHPSQISEQSLASPSTKRQQEILNRLAELRAGLQQKERECYNTTWSR